MADVKPSKENIQAIFKKLRSAATNKTCFDCNAKNPTWASVTYGVFICIDCSAVHRGLGVHLTFVRSTQLDTNWTWLQLRQMQLGGNASASVFFRQHNCVTTDSQQKYTSRAAQLYKDKLSQTASAAMRIHGTELHLETSSEKNEEPAKEVDFFEEHSSFAGFGDDSSTDTTSASPSFQYDIQTPKAIPVENTAASLSSNKGPSVDLSAPIASSGERKSIIGGRKPAVKKIGLGGKKAGLGAQRVQTNFADLERQAEMIDQRKEKVIEEPKATAEEEEEQMVSMRLAYQDLGVEQQKEADRMKRSDPKKAQQVERLGMGFSAKSGISHSALSDMMTIDQETPVKSGGSKSAYDSDAGDEFFDDYSLKAFNFSMIRNTPRLNDKLSDLLESSSGSGRDRYGIKEEKPADIPSSKSWYDGLSQENRARRDPLPSSAYSDREDAQKKFGNAKAISSDQYFGQTSEPSYEQKANLSRFEGSTSISSSDYFQDGRSSTGSRPGYGSGISASISAPDLDEVKESVRQGVTKVAGKISSMANGVINSIQERYGY